MNKFLFLEIIQLKKPYWIGMILFLNLYSGLTYGKKEIPINLTEVIVNLEVKNTSVEDIFNEIENQTEFMFIYNHSVIDGLIIAKLTASGKSLKDVLADISVKAGLNFKQINHTLAVSKKTIQPSGYDNSADRILQGQVLSGENNEPLPGANIAVSGTNIGTVADIDGNFKLQVPEKFDSLIISYIGFVLQKIAIGNKSEFKILLKPDTKQLSELVVTALGISREKIELAHTIQKIDGQQVNNIRETNFINSLSGKIAGVQVTGNANSLSGSANIVIRGSNSITGNNQPLFVVDGLPINNTSFATLEQQSGRNGNESDGVNIAGNFDYGNPAQDINPDDIESIIVLKGANAAALYGARAANGVVLITTKSGKGDKGIGVTVNSSLMLQQPYLFPDYQNEYGGGSGDFNRFAEDGTPIAWGNSSWSWGPRLDGQPVMHWDDQRRPWEANPDNIRDFYQTGTTLTNNVSLTAGGDYGSFRLSFTDLDQTGISPNSKVDRQNVNISATANLSKRLSATANVNYTYNEVIGRSVNGDNEESVERYILHYSFNRQVDLNRLKDYENPDGSMRSWLRDQNGEAVGIQGNPYWTRYKNFSYDDRERVFGNVVLTYQFFDWLKLTARAGSDFYNDRRQERLSIGTPRQIPFYAEDIRFVKESNFDALLQFDKKISSDFSISGLIGGNTLRYLNDRSRGRSQGGLSTPDFYSLENSIDRPLIIDNTFRKRINSVFANATLGYKDLFFLDMSARNDWSSTLPEANNSYLYPSIGASFVFSELLPSNFINFGKIRASLAQVGNDTDPYQLQTVYTPGVSFGSNPVYYIPESLSNNNLKPERTTSLELGTNLQLLNNRLELDFTYYNSVTRDQIFGVPVTPASGYIQKVLNAGEMKNEGIEIMLGGSPIITPSGFQWDLTLNFARNRNQVVSLVDDIEFIQLAQYYDMQLLAIPGEPYGSLYSTAVARDEAGNMLVTDAGFYKQGPRQVVGNVQPDFTGGLINSFSYKGFNLSFLVDFKKGGDLFSGGIRSGTRSGVYAESAVNNVRELGLIAIGVNENDGQENDVRVSAQNFFNNMRVNYSFFVWDASYIKLREARLAYTLPARIVAKTPFKDIQASLIGRNLAILYKVIPHIDPEVAVSAGNVQGIEVGSLPGTRTFGFNLNFTF